MTSASRTLRGPRSLSALAALTLGACGGTDRGAPANPPLETTGCVAPQGVSASPRNIDELVTLVNALQREHGTSLTIPCVVESLERPLGILAAESVLSLQPAMGRRSPRFFLFSGDLVLSIATGTEGHDLLEMSTRVSDTRSIKAEMGFPLQGALSPAAVYDRIRLGNGTSCGFCHGFELPAAGVAITQAYESVIFRPLESQQVDLAFLRSEYDACDRQAEPDRCAMLAAVFGHGELEAQAFSPAARTIYDP
jgi:hypothetical protein